MTGVGQSIKLLRTLAGLKQSDLAAQLGVSPNYISLIENERRDPSLSFLRQVSGHLGVPLGLLFLGVEVDQAKVSSEEKALLLRLRDLVFEIERLRLRRQRQQSHGS